MTEKKKGRGNPENLVSFATRSTKELREIQRRGGINSGKARRRKADLKKAMKTLLAMDVTKAKDRKLLEDLGMEVTNENLLVLATYQQAVKGNQRAMENIIKLSTSDKDKHDIDEQKERIKALKLKNAKESAGANNEENIIIYDDV